MYDEMKEYVQSSAHDHPSLFMITHFFLFMVSLVLRPWDIIMVVRGLMGASITSEHIAFKESGQSQFIYSF